MEGAIVLTREQLKRVTGGNIGSGGNATECTNDDDCEKRTYTCKDGDIEDCIKDKIIELNTIVELQFYPDSPIGFYKIYHYDIEMAVDDAIKIINN